MHNPSVVYDANLQHKQNYNVLQTQTILKHPIQV